MPPWRNMETRMDRASAAVPPGAKNSSGMNAERMMKRSNPAPSEI